MAKEIPPEELITIRIVDYCDALLRQDECASIPKYLAEILEVKCRGKCNFYIQWPDKYNPELRGPRLWRYSTWVETSEKWEKDRKRSEDERRARFVFNENVSVVRKALMKNFNLDDNHASVVAYNLLKKNAVELIKEAGVEKLITTIEEIT